MKKNFILTAALILLSGAGLAWAGAPGTAAASQEAEAQPDEAKVKQFKDILFKLVRQDEYLDEAVETLDTSSARPTNEELSALGISLKAIAKNLNHVAALNKTEFAAIEPGSNLSKYTNTILSYSRKVDRKAGQVGALIAQLAVKNRKTAMRDAVSAKKGSRKAGAKKLTQILEEQKVMERLAVDAKNLRGASRNLAATSKWLYIASN